MIMTSQSVSVRRYLCWFPDELAAMICTGGMTNTERADNIAHTVQRHHWLSQDNPGKLEILIYKSQSSSSPFQV